MTVPAATPLSRGSDDRPVPAAVTIQGLVKSFGPHGVFDGFDLIVGRGERLAVLGASGCGKSTLLRCIAGLEKPQAGRITVAGEVGFVFQEPRLFPWLSVEGNVAFAARNEAERARIGDVLALVGLTSARKKLPKELSGGMAQRAALARTLVRGPEVILLDEPLAALDALRRLELRAALREIIDTSGATAILVTHDVDEALEVGNRFLVLERAPNGVRAREPVGQVDDGSRQVLLAALGVSLAVRPAPRVGP
jgi:sulfonate transport system ATP-binding protein